MGIDRRTPPRPGRPAAHVSDYLALLPSGPDAVHRLKLHRFRVAVRPTTTEVVSVRGAGGRRQADRRSAAKIRQLLRRVRPRPDAIRIPHAPSIVRST